VQCASCRHTQLPACTACNRSFNYKNLSEAAVYGQTVCQLLNCSTGLSTCDSACMRAAPAAAVVHAWGEAAGNAIDFIIADLGHILDGFLQV